ncbi:MAG: S1 RNA-binding domain-containing protein [Oscillospiraceae bacterium]|nr:S1 RNA-binding domain-containing protein [Oscillospiraceae bacterium]
MRKYLPEGSLINSGTNKKMCESITSLKKAYENEIVLEGICTRCDREHNLFIKVGEFEGMIPRLEGAYGINVGMVKDIAIISRVGKPVAFVITGISDSIEGTKLLLSRKRVQEKFLEECVSEMKPGDIISATVTHLESFGAFVDIGVGVSALLPVDNISVSRIPHPSARFKPGQRIKCVVKSKENDKVTLSHKELLGTWEENAKKIIPGETIPGIVRSVEDYGIFVELTPNLSGLAEFVPNVKPGQLASVYIKSICSEKMKIKLIIIDSFDFEGDKTGNRKVANMTELQYYLPEEDHIDRFIYSPENAYKLVETVFCDD